MGSCQVPPRCDRRARCAAWTARLLVSAALLAAAAGCGRRHEGAPSALGFEKLADTTGLSTGPTLLTAFEPVRYANGLLQVRGAARFPDGTRIQVKAFDAATRRLVALVTVTVQDGRFESAPILGEHGPLPAGPYRFELLAQFTPVWQPDAVLAATDNGRSLRGPGMLRGNAGLPAFQVIREQRL